MKEKYRFDIEKGVFTLLEPETGKDWSNHFFNESGYVTSVSHLGIPWSRYIDRNAVQVTLNCPYSSFIYLRDAETKEYWNPAGYPSLKKIKRYQCEHGQQYTKISSEYIKIYASVTYAVAKDDTREVWQVVLTNRSDKKRKLELFAVTAFDLNGYAQPVYYSAATTSFTEFIPEVNGIFNENLNPYRPHERASGYIFSSEPVKAYDGNYEAFIGTMGSQTKPSILEKGLDCTDSQATVRSRGGILENAVELLPGESKTVYYVLGLIQSKEKLIKSRQSFVRECEKIIDGALNGQDKFGHIGLHCPETQLNRVMNFWAEHQVSYCMLGKKAVRDNAQLALAMLNFDPAFAKKTIEECLVHEYSDGHSVLTWYPYLETNIYSDPSVWLAFAVCGYVKESGDIAYLDATLPYLNGGNGTVYEHLKKIAEWYSNAENYGKNGLPKIFHADWNDALNIPDENAESVLMGMLVCKAFSEIAELAEYIGEKEYAFALRENEAALAGRINCVAWNGEYYVRALSKFGKIGDKTCENGGKIYVNPQSWSILSGVCPKEREESVLKAIDGMENEHGIPLCDPPYERYDEKVGRMSGMLKGVYENGGIYNHAGLFKIFADCRLKRGDQAVATLKKIIPDGEYNPSSVTTAEPYVFTNCYLRHPSVSGKVGFSWQTGSSAWVLICVFEGIFGLTRSFDGLRIDPCFPGNWKFAEVRRSFRGDKFHIKYVNKGGSCIFLTVDGKNIEGNILPVFGDGKEHKVTVTLSERRKKR